MDPESVINVGHSAKQPLIRPRSELADGLEPHDQFYLRYTAVVLTYWYRGSVEGVPGVRWLGGYWEGSIPGTTQPPDLRLIYGIIRDIPVKRPYEPIREYIIKI